MSDRNRHREPPLGEDKAPSAVAIQKLGHAPLNSPVETDALALFRHAFSAEQCQAWLAGLIEQLSWHKDYYEVHGRRFHIPRLQAWVADTDIQYSHSNNLLAVQPWSPLLRAIKRKVEARVGHRFNAVLITYYRNGGDHVTWHADDERELGDAPVIASLSLGATRTFQYKPKDGEEVEGLPLDEGDLLLMRPAFQQNWLHRVPSEPEVASGRINLTFRRVVAGEAFERQREQGAP